MQYFINARNKVFAFESAEEMQLFAKEPLTPITEERAKELTKPPLEHLIAEVESARKAAYASESDPLFFKTQRGEATEQEWLNKINEIKLRYPMPTQADPNAG